MPTTADYLGDLVNLRKELATNLACNPALVKASEDETFSTLVPKAFKVMDEVKKITKGMTSMEHAFSNTSIESCPDIDFTGDCTNLSSMFSGCKQLKNVGDIAADSATSLFNMFYNCEQLQTVGHVYSKNCESFGEMFHTCKSLHTIKSIDFTNAKSLSGYLFWACWSLTDLTVHGTIGVSISFETCPSLSVESLKSLINALVDYSDTVNANKYTFRFDNRGGMTARLLAEGNTSPNGNTWIDYISDKGWVVKK